MTREQEPVLHVLRLEGEPEFLQAGSPIMKSVMDAHSLALEHAPEQSPEFQMMLIATHAGNDLVGKFRTYWERDEMVKIQYLTESYTLTSMSVYAICKYDSHPDRPHRDYFLLWVRTDNPNVF